jgi:hypothetical protein
MKAELARRDALSIGEAGSWIAGAPALIGRDFGPTQKPNGVLAFLIRELALGVTVRLTGHDHACWSSTARALRGKAVKDEAEIRKKIAIPEFIHWEPSFAKRVYREKRPGERGLFLAAGRVADSIMAKWRADAVGDDALAVVVKKFDPNERDYDDRRTRLARALRDIAERHGPKLSRAQKSAREPSPRLLEAIRAAL